MIGRRTVQILKHGLLATAIGTLLLASLFILPIQAIALEAPSQRRSQKYSSIETAAISSSSVDIETADANIIAPTDGSIVSGTVPIECDASADEDETRSYLYIDGTQVDFWTDDGTHDYSWDTTQYSDGNHEIKLEVVEVRWTT